MLQSRHDVATTTRFPANLEYISKVETGAGGVRFAAFASLLVLVFAGASFLGNWLPLGDSLTVFRMHLIFLGLGLAAFAARPGKLSLGLILAAVFIFQWGAPFAASSESGAPDGRVYSLYQKNLLNTGATPNAIAADILTSAPDFVTLQEISDANLKTIERLNAHFGSMVVCRASPSRGVALLAKHRIVEGTSRCYPDLDLVVTKVEIDSGPVWLASMHLRWPFPFDQHEQSRRISKILSELEGEVIVAGDFNMVREGSSVRRIGRASGANVAGERKTTFPRFNPVLPIEIDHVLLPLGSDAVVDLRPLLGSDHYGLFAVFSL